MNLFSNIFDQFTGQAQPQLPVGTPKAPRTTNYVAPNVAQPVQKPSMTLFSDEQQMFQKMKSDNLDDNTAYSMLKKRRMDILGGNDLGDDEKTMLLKMQADNIPVKQAVSMIQKRRADQFNKKYEEGNLLQKGAYNTLAFAAGNLETLAKYSGNTLDFITGGTMGFGDEVNKMEQVTQSPEFSQSSAFKAGTYAPDVALAVSPIGGGYLAGAKGLPQLALRSGIVGAGFGATQPIMEKGSDATLGDIATGGSIGGVAGAVATPVLSKVLKYGQAGYRGGLTGMGKSIARDTKAGIQAITPSGANISTKANRFNANEIREFTKRTGQSPGDFATSRGMTKVGDDAVVEATNLWKASKDQADEALQAIKGRFRFTDEGEDLLKTTINDLETRLVNTKSPDSKRISQLKAKYEDSGLTMSEINEIKRAYSNNYKYSFVDAGSESALRSKNLQDAVRKWQFKVAEENGLTNLKDINKTTQGWKMFADSLSKKIQGSSGNNNVSLTDWIALSGGGPENIALYLGKKLASSDKVKSGAIKLFSKKTKPSIIQASKADIQQANFKKDVNRGVSGVGDNSGGKSLVKPVGLLEAPKGKATGAKNVRVNQPIEKAPIKNEGQVGNRPGTVKKPIVKPNTIKNESVVPKKTVNTPIVEKSVEAKYKVFNQKGDAVYIGNKIGADEVIQRAKSNGVEYTIKPIKTKITKSVDAETIKSDIIGEYRHIKGGADDVPNYAKGLRGNGKEYIIDGEKAYVNGGIEGDTYYLQSFAVENKGKGNGMKIIEKMIDNSFNKGGTNRFEVYSITPGAKGFWEKVGKKYGVNLKESKNGIGNLIIEKGGRQSANTPKTVTPPSNAKQQVIKPVSSDTIPEGYIENPMTGEIIKKPSWKTGGFIKIPEIGKKVDPLIEEAKKYNSADEFVKAQANTYHGTSQTFDKFSKEGLGRSTSTIAGKKGFWFTDSPEEAVSYAKLSGKHMLKDEIRVEKEINKLIDQITIAEKKGNWDLADKLTGEIEVLEQASRAGGLEIVMPIKINKSKLFKYDASGKSMNQGRIDEVITKAKKEGYEGVTFKNISDNPDDASVITTQHIVFDPKNIKTDAELKRIYEQSKSPVKNPLVEEARKYKSAEDFEKALRNPRGIGYGGNMGILWRATSKPFKPDTKTIIEHGITDSGDTKSYAKDILLSNDYGKSEPYLISKDAKIASWREGNEVYKITKESAFSKKSIEEFKKRGFDGFERGADEIVIFNNAKINPLNINDFFENYIK